MKRWAIFALLVFAANFAWEMMQARWFASMHGLPAWHASLLCLRATVGDFVITLVAFAVAAAVARSAVWPVGPRSGMAATIFVAVGIAITAGYERFALSTGQWRYDVRMPTVFGVGVLPLLQWLALPAAEAFLFRLMWRRRIQGSSA